MSEKEIRLEEILQGEQVNGITISQATRTLVQASNPWEIPEITVSEFRQRYKRIERLGYGGQAEVFLVADTKDEEQKYALKILPVGEEEKKEKRVFREVEALQRLDHSGIARNYALFFVKDEETNASYFYLLNQYVAGRTLAEKTAKKNVEYFPEERIVNILNQCVDILDHAHKRGVIHLDIKPSNIKIDDTDKVVVLDWGISRLREELTRTLPNMIAGSPRYMAPEQMKGSGIVPETDYYSLGMTIVNLMLGDKQFNDPYIALDYKDAVRKTKYSNGLKERIIAMIDENPRLRQSYKTKQERATNEDISLEAKLVVSSGFGTATATMTAVSWWSISNLFGFSDITPMVATALAGIGTFVYGYYVDRIYEILRKERVKKGKTVTKSEEEFHQFIKWLQITVDRKFHPEKHVKFIAEKDAIQKLSAYREKGHLDNNDWVHITEYLQHDNDTVRTRAFQMFQDFSCNVSRFYFGVRKTIYERIGQPSSYEGFRYIVTTGERGEVTELILTLCADRTYSDSTIKPKLKEIAEECLPLNKTKDVDEKYRRSMKAIIDYHCK